jgi:hypothetical protein
VVGPADYAVQCVFALGSAIESKTKELFRIIRIPGTNDIDEQKKMIEILKEAEIIDEVKKEQLDSIRELRNKAAHPPFVLSASEKGIHFTHVKYCYSALIKYFDTQISLLTDSAIKEKEETANEATKNDIAAKQKYEYYVEILDSAKNILDTSLFPEKDYFYLDVHYKAVFVNKIPVLPENEFCSRITFFLSKEALDAELEAGERKTIFCEDMTVISDEARIWLADNTIGIGFFMIQLKVNDLRQSEVGIESDLDGIYLHINNLDSLGFVESFEIEYIIPRLKSGRPYPIAITAPTEEVLVDVRYNPKAFHFKQRRIELSTESLPGQIEVKNVIYDEHPSERKHIYHYEYIGSDMSKKERQKYFGKPMIECEIRYVGE